MSYRVYLPEGIDQPGKSFPVVMWISNDSGLRQLLDNVSSGPYASVVVVPGYRNTQEWSSVKTCTVVQASTYAWCPPGLTPRMELYLDALDEVEADYAIDSTKRVLTGYSAGGAGTFDVLLSRPGFFDAALPIQSGHEARRFREPVGTRVWALHGRDDPHAPYHTSSTVEAITRQGETPIYLEPPGTHSAEFIPSFFEDVDNDLYPWLFDGVDPSLAKLIYNPVNGNVQIDATTAPGGMISKMSFAGHSLSEPDIDAINNEPLTYHDGRVTYEASDGLGFGEVVDLGEVLPPGMNLTDLHTELFAHEYDSVAATSMNRTFRLVMASPDASQEVEPVTEEPWVVYGMDEDLSGARDLGTLSSYAVGGRRGQRVIMKFQLPSSSDDERPLESATLQLYLRASDESAGVAVGHASGENNYAFLPSDYDNDAYSDTLLNLVSTDAPARNFYELDVTEWVAEDYAVDRNTVTSSFRLQLDGDTESQFRLAMPGDREFFPRLILSYGVPSVFGDFNGDGRLDIQDLEQLTRESASGLHPIEYDLNEDSLVDIADIERWVTSPDAFNSWIGDANLDGEFNSGDLVQVFASGHYEDDIAMNSGWAEGDWNGDGDFDTGDLVFAFQDGGYERAARAVAPFAVPEPSSLLIAWSGLVSLGICRRLKGQLAI